jgi:hypothetical protein
MPRASTLSRVAVAVVAALIVVYLALVAALPDIVSKLPRGLDWFGAPGSLPTLTIGVAALAAACWQLYRSASGRRSGAPIAIVLVLSVTAFFLGIVSYAPCGVGRTRSSPS